MQKYMVKTKFVRLLLQIKLRRKAAERDSDNKDLFDQKPIVNLQHSGGSRNFAAVT